MKPTADRNIGVCAAPGESKVIETAAAAAPRQLVRRDTRRRVVADDREARSGVPTTLASRLNVDLTVRRLRLGDYIIDNTLIVERKTFADFACSVIDGRLFMQASRLARVRRLRPCVILEGSLNDLGSPVISRPAMQGTVITVTLVFGLPLLRSACPEETADLIVYAAEQLSCRTTAVQKRPGHHPRGLARLQSFLLQAIPGIGPARARLLLDTFGSPIGVASATLEDLQTVDGIGKSAAAKIHQVFHGP